MVFEFQAYECGMIHNEYTRQRLNMHLTSVVRFVRLAADSTQTAHLETIMVTHTLMLAVSSELSQRIASALISA